MRTFRVYGDTYDDADDEEEVFDYLALWAVHGPSDGREVEYPVVSFTNSRRQGRLHSSADPTYSTTDENEIPEDFYEFFAGTVARVAEEGTDALETVHAFAPDDWPDGLAYLTSELVLMLAHGREKSDEDRPPFEAEWALQRGVEEIEESIGVTELEEAVDDD